MTKQYIIEKFNQIKAESGYKSAKAFYDRVKLVRPKDVSELVLDESNQALKG
jgi:hypothetical protein